jgi:hypothetical protein
MNKINYFLSTEKGRNILKVAFTLLALTGLVIGGVAEEPGVGLG